MREGQISLKSSITFLRPPPLGRCLLQTKELRPKTPEVFVGNKGVKIEDPLVVGFRLSVFGKNTPLPSAVSFQQNKKAGERESSLVHLLVSG
jgi:hypothetical protein